MVEEFPTLATERGGSGALVGQGKGNRKKRWFDGLKLDCGGLVGDKKRISQQ